MKHRKRKGIRGLILALATAAVLVPAANGYVYAPGGSEAKSPGYSPQALKAMSERYTKMAESYQQAGSAAVSGSHGGLYPGSGAGPGSTVTGSTRPDDRAGIHGVGTPAASSDYVDRQVANLQAKADQGAAASHADDRAGIRGPGPIETPSTVSVRGDGFDWTDAGIGFSVALVAAAMLAAATLVRRRAGLAV